MSFFTPKPLGSILTGSETRNCFPWRGRDEANLTRIEWSAPYPLVVSGSTEMEIMSNAQVLIDDPRNLVVGMSEIHFAVGLKGEPNTWYLTLVVQRAVPRSDAK
jgi:hypothetical protein